MRITRLLFLGLIWLLFLTAPQVNAQQCSVVKIDGPENVEDGEGVALIASLTVDPSTVKEFRWSVSAGTITSGQNTASVTIDTTGLGGQNLTATLELLGVTTNCSTQASWTIAIPYKPFICGLAFDEYGDIKFADEQARLDNFAVQLMNMPAAQGQLTAYAGQKTYPNEAAERLKRAKNYLVNVRDIDPRRILTLDCGHRKDLNVSLHTIPPGATPPVCDTSLLVPTSELNFSKPHPKSRRRRHQSRKF